MEITYPDYDRSLLSLISSILRHYGVVAAHKSLPELDALLSENYKNVVLMVFDGMGSEIIQKHLPDNSFFLSHKLCDISSVFPPTTTAATVALESGLSPAEHGWLGWCLYFNEIDANVNIFPNTLSGSGGTPAASFHLAQKYMPYKTVFEKITQSGCAHAYHISPFAEIKAESVPEICENVKKLCALEGRKYIYTYWPEPDYLVHDYGTNSPLVSELIRRLDSQIQSLSSELRDTLLIITADHGLVDTDYMFLTDFPELCECLVHPPSIETRALSFFVKENMRSRFEALFHERFGDCYILMPGKRVLELGLFGSGTPHPRTAGFIGDYIAAATGKISLDYAGGRQDIFKAAHAGLTRDEMTVALITAALRG